MDILQQLRFQVFNLTKNGEHDYDAIKTMTTKQGKKTTKIAQLIMLKKVHDLNDELQQAKIEHFDTEEEIGSLIKAMIDTCYVLQKKEGYKDVAWSYTRTLG